MKHQETLALSSNKPIEPELLIELGNHLQQHDIELSFLEVESYCLEDCKRLIMEKGTSYVLSLEKLQEAVLPKTESRAAQDLLVKVLRNQLETLSPSKSLIIIDPYFLPADLPNKATYLNTFREIFGAIIPKITDIRFITRPNSNDILYQSIRQVLTDLNPHLSINHRTTKDFHDRFWIVDEKKGLFIGTSLNGIGMKYALTDYMRDEDTAAVVDALRRLNLL